MLGDVRQRLLLLQGSRVRINYTTRMHVCADGTLPVWGASTPPSSKGQATTTARVLRIEPHYVVLQPDRHPRPVALCLQDVCSVTAVLVNKPWS